MSRVKRLSNTGNGLPAGASVLNKKKLVRQAKFREDGVVTDVPAKDSEKPQLEKQSDLFQFEKDRDNLKRLK